MSGKVLTRARAFLTTSKVVKYVHLLCLLCSAINTNNTVDPAYFAEYRHEIREIVVSLEKEHRVSFGRFAVLESTVANETLTRADLAEAVYKQLGLSRTESADLVELILSEISDAIERGENVKLSSFGSFLVRSKSERIGRNPKTGVEVAITPRRVMVFKASNVLKARINGIEMADEDE